MIGVGESCDLGTPLDLIRITKPRSKEASITPFSCKTSAVTTPKYYTQSFVKSSIPFASPKVKPPQRKEGQDFYKQFFEYFAFLLRRVQEGDTEISEKISKPLEDLLNKLQISSETVIKEWESSIDPCKALITYLLRSCKVKDYQGYKRDSMPILIAKLPAKINNKTLLSKDSKASITDITNNELYSFKAEIKGDKKEERSKCNLEWDKHKEEYYKEYKKIAQNLIKSPKATNQAWDLIGLRNCFPKTTDYYNESKRGEDRFVFTLSQMKNYLAEREKNLKEAGYYNEKINRLLDKIYVAVVKLVISERTISDFQGKVQQCKNDRLTYLVNRCTSKQEKLQQSLLKIINRRKSSEQLAQKRKNALTLVKRYKNVLKGYEKNLVTRPEPTRFYDDSLNKNGTTRWTPVFLMDEERKIKEREEIRNLFTGQVEKKTKSTDTFLIKKNWNKDKAREYVSTGPSRSNNNRMSIGLIAKAALRIQRYYRRFKLRKQTKKLKLSSEATPAVTPFKSSATSPKPSGTTRTFARSTITSPRASLQKLTFEGFNTRGLNLTKEKGGTIIMRNINLSRDKKKEQNPVNFHEKTVKRYCKMKEASLINNVLSASKKNTVSYIEKKAKQGTLNAGNVNFLDENDCSALFYACVHGYPKMAQILLKHGADPNLPNAGGNTALHQAFKTDKIELVGLLLDNGAKVDVQNNLGQTPLYFAKPKMARRFGLHKEVTFVGGAKELYKAATVSTTPEKQRQGVKIKGEKCGKICGNEDMRKMVKTYKGLLPFFEQV